MKLAEALILRADHEKRLAQLEKRLCQNAHVQEGDKPAEEPSKLLEQFEKTARALEDLIRRITITITRTELEPGKTLTDVLAERDVLRIRYSAYRSVAGASSGNPFPLRCLFDARLTKD